MASTIQVDKITDIGGNTMIESNGSGTFTSNLSSNVSSATGGGGTIVSFASGNEAFLRYVNVDTTTLGYTLMGELEVSANNAITAFGTQTYQV